MIQIETVNFCIGLVGMISGILGAVVGCISLHKIGKVRNAIDKVSISIRRKLNASQNAALLATIHDKLSSVLSEIGPEYENEYGWGTHATLFALLQDVTPMLSSVAEDETGSFDPFEFTPKDTKKLQILSNEICGCLKTETTEKGVIVSIVQLIKDVQFTLGNRMERWKTNGLIQ
ncbi:MAG: hypothetical protein RR313_11100 [Anaerovoracaceae bacterium]